MDCLVYGTSPSTRLAFTFVNATQTARTLERRHLCGPTAARVLGESLTAVALLSGNLGDEDERLTLQLRVDGPVGGVLCDAAFMGGMRGYTHAKVMNELDGSDDTDLRLALGQSGTMSVIHHTSDRVIYQGLVEVSPPDLRTAVARYCIDSLQRPSGVELLTTCKEGYLDRCVGFLAEKMPDGDTEAFVAVLERFNDSTVRQALERCDTLDKFGNLLGVNDLQVTEGRTLKFECGCSRQKIVDVVTALPLTEVEEIVDEGEGQTVTCHFCGETYAIDHEGMQAILHRKAADRN